MKANLTQGWFFSQCAILPPFGGMFGHIQFPASRACEIGTEWRQVKFIMADQQLLQEGCEI